jgi:hypothetical protein
MLCQVSISALSEKHRHIPCAIGSPDLPTAIATLAWQLAVKRDAALHFHARVGQAKEKALLSEIGLV